MAETFSELLRAFGTAAELGKALKAHSCEVSPGLVRRWWNEEMLPDRAWLPFVEACKVAGREDITLETLARIAVVPREQRLAILAKRRAAELAEEAATA